MGYDSVTRILAQKTRVEKDGYEKEIVALFLEIADSNLRDEYNRMVRSWSLFRPGLDWEVMQHLVCYAANCESGMLRYKGREAKAETLIRACRKAIKEAPLVERFSDSNAPMTIHRFAMTLAKDAPLGLYQKELDAAREAGVVERCYNREGREFLIFDGSPEGLAAFVGLEGLADGNFVAFDWLPCREKAS